MLRFVYLPLGELSFFGEARGYTRTKIPTLIIGSIPLFVKWIVIFPNFSLALNVLTNSEIAIAIPNGNSNGPNKCFFF